MSSVEGTLEGVSLPARVIYPERQDRIENWVDKLGIAIEGFVVTRAQLFYVVRLSRIVKLVDGHTAEMLSMDDSGLREIGRNLRVELRQGRVRDATVARAFALIREVATRTVEMRHFDVQLIGGFALLKGMIVEMETGEGKTLTATLPACTSALAGTPVHIVTVNDYLARRDADWMGPIYRFLGLSVGTVVQGVAPDARREAYGRDVTYCTNKDLTFDYLRDRLILGTRTGNLRLKLERLYGDESRTHRLLLRGLHFAIVDEADSVLIDEARTPLIITGEADSEDQRLVSEQALEAVEQLEEGRHYKIWWDERSVELTAAGKARLREVCEPLGRVWQGTIMREELGRLALSAKFLFHRDEHYLVRDGKVEIVDEYTGRVMADRFWSEGLHQLIEVKEGCEPSGRRLSLARITYQRFFRRYKRLAGMTGTAKEVSGEFWAVFRLPVVRVPTNRPLHRVFLRDRVRRTADQKWRLITRRVAELHRQGRPVLLGTRSVAASEEASRYLSQAGLEHQILNAAQDKDEAEIITRAGERGQITIATNMAGRGTDIKIDPEVARLGGLHVIMSERHDAGRVDRQLAGRSGRHGEPGSFEAILSLEDQLLEINQHSFSGRVIGAMARVIGDWPRRIAMATAQRRAERLHSRMRRDLLKLDKALGNLLAFSGRME